MILSYLKYLTASHSVSRHPSDAIQKLNSTIFSKNNDLNDASILSLIKTLKQDETLISITDLGAGSKQTKGNNRTIKSIVKNASIPPKYGKLLNKFIKHHNYKTVVELGTSLGIGTSYLALDNTETTVYTIEGCPNILTKAQQNLKTLNIHNVQFFQGEFSTQFKVVLSHFNQADLVYIDGNHTYEATIDYFNFFKSKLTQHGIFVFDDIHWSKGMEKAWQEILNDSETTLTLDFFRMGIVFINPDFKKEHLVLRY